MAGWRRRRRCAPATRMVHARVAATPRFLGAYRPRPNARAPGPAGSLAAHRRPRADFVLYVGCSRRVRRPGARPRRPRRRPARRRRCARACRPAAAGARCCARPSRCRSGRRRRRRSPARAAAARPAPAGAPPARRTARGRARQHPGAFPKRRCLSSMPHCDTPHQHQVPHMQMYYVLDERKKRPSKPLH